MSDQDEKKENKSAMSVAMGFLGALVGSGVAVYLFQQILPIETIRGSRMECNLKSTNMYLPLAIGPREVMIGFFPENPPDPKSDKKFPPDTQISLDSAPIPAGTDDKITKMSHPPFKICVEHSKSQFWKCEKWSNDGTNHIITRSTLRLISVDDGVVVRGIITKKDDVNSVVENLDYKLITARGGFLNSLPVVLENCKYPI